MQPTLLQMAAQATAHLSDDQLDQIFTHTHIILSAPRAGSTLLFEQLIKQDNVWSIGNESHVIFSQFPHLKFENSQMESGCLTEDHADRQTVRLIKAAFLFMMKNNQEQRYIDPNLPNKPSQPVFIEKTPRNALNIPFLLKIFPKAKFIYLYRDPRQNIASLIEAWHIGLQTGRFAIYTQLPDWHLPAWCFLLPRGWQNFIGKTIPEICNFQWCESNRIILDHLNQYKPEHSIKLSFHDLTEKTNACLKELMYFIHSSKDINQVDTDLNFSKTTLSTPNPDKWKKHQQQIMSMQNLWQVIETKIKKRLD